MKNYHKELRTSILNIKKELTGDIKNITKEIKKIEELKDFKVEIPNIGFEAAWGSKYYMDIKKFNITFDNSIINKEHINKRLFTIRFGTYAFGFDYYHMSIEFKNIFNSFTIKDKILPILEKHLGKKTVDNIIFFYK